MRIAYLILCHTDAQHIARLANKLTKNTQHDVYIHVDKKVDINPFSELLNTNKSVYLIKNRVNVFWGGYNSIIATINLLQAASEQLDYDRYILLQGLDYPLWSNNKITDFFEKNPDKEFIRACKITDSKEKYFFSKARYLLFYDYPNTLKKISNKIMRLFNLKLKAGYIKTPQANYDLYWGCAQWALTHKCILYILDFYQKETDFNNYFKTTFPADEIYFHTIIFNSPFSLKTTFEGPEPEKKYLTNWRNLHYFEYKGSIRIYTQKDYNLLSSKNEMFVRKVTTSASSELLDLIDSDHQKDTTNITKI